MKPSSLKRRDLVFVPAKEKRMAKRPIASDPAAEAMVLKWIKDGLAAGAARGLSQSGLGRALGLSPQQGSKLVNGDRRVVAYELPAISAYLGRPIPPFGATDQCALPVLCDANTPHWSEESAFGPTIDTAATTTAGAVMSEEFTGLRQFAVRIVGNSLNRKISDGAFAICVSYDQARKKPLDRDFVVVEINRHNLHKVMARHLRRVGSSWELQPYSSAQMDKKQTLKLSPDLRHILGSPEDKIVIRGLIIGVYGAI